MPKKSRKKDLVIKIFENTEIESLEAHAKSTESAKPEPQIEAVVPDTVEQETAAEMSGSDEQAVSEEALLFWTRASVG